MHNNNNEPGLFLALATSFLLLVAVTWMVVFA